MGKKRRYVKKTKNIIKIDGGGEAGGVDGNLVHENRSKKNNPTKTGEKENASLWFVKDKESKVAGGRG